MRWENKKGTVELSFVSQSQEDSTTTSDLIQKGLAHHGAGRFKEAEAIYQSILEEQPQHPDALYLMGLVAHQMGKNEIAVNLIENAIKINPNMPDFYNACGAAYRALRKYDFAIARFEQALAIRPEFTEAHNNLGNLLHELGRHEDAITHFERALTIKPDCAEALNNLRSNLVVLGRYEEAIASFERALAIKPDFADALNNLGSNLVILGRHEEAIAHFEQALTIKPDYAEAHMNLSVIKPKQGQISIIEEFLTSPTVSEKDSMHYHYALGSIYNATKSYTKAFAHYLKNNTLKRKTITYDSQNHSDYVDRLIKAYSISYFHDKTAGGSDSELPVFIVGMPRSGTTLVEQIVASHPQVYGAGEKAFIERIEEAIARQFEVSSPYPECMSLCNKSIATVSSEKYVKEIGKYSPDAIRITDKMPDNFLRIGLIKTIFPHARIIHCQRNPLDTCTSIFVTNFADVHGNEYSFDLTELGRYYLDYKRLMTHWHSLFSSEIFEVQYEELVMNQEKVSRQLIEYLKLDWDEKCLDFHHNKRGVRTASSLQVRKPMYKNSINRWKRYEQHLGPLLEILKDHI